MDPCGAAQSAGWWCERECSPAHNSLPLQNYAYMYGGAVFPMYSFFTATRTRIVSNGAQQARCVRCMQAGRDSCAHARSMRDACTHARFMHLESVLRVQECAHVHTLCRWPLMHRVEAASRSLQAARSCRNARSAGTAPSLAADLTCTSWLASRGRPQSSPCRRANRAPYVRTRWPEDVVARRGVRRAPPTAFVPCLVAAASLCRLRRLLAPLTTPTGLSGRG